MEFINPLSSFSIILQLFEFIWFNESYFWEVESFAGEFDYLLLMHFKKILLSLIIRN